VSRRSCIAIVYDRGLHQPDPYVPGQVQPNRYENNFYALVAHQLPWFGLEPYAMLEMGYLPLGSSDLSVTPSSGLNVHFSPSVLLKMQVLETLFNATRSGSKSPGTDLNDWDFTSFYSRLVLVF
jgi:hypothetical protein